MPIIETTEPAFIKLKNKTIASYAISIMVQTYFEIDKRIVEHEQCDKGFSRRNLKQMRQFYITYSISQTVPAQLKLSWSHYLVLMRVNNINERNFYKIESISNNGRVS